jgi:uncharacterized protein (DUF302 family)
MKEMTGRAFHWAGAVLLASLPQSGLGADSGLVTMPSKYSVHETIERFEAAIRAKSDQGKSDQGWMVSTELGHAAAAAKSGLTLPPRTVIVFGNPRGGTPNMQKAPTLAIDVPPKAVVWQDDQGKVWLTFDSSDYLQNYVYPRHGLPSNPAAAEAFEEFVKHAAEQATE